MLALKTPLTPALSRSERENRSLSVGESYVIGLSLAELNCSLSLPQGVRVRGVSHQIIRRGRI